MARIRQRITKRELVRLEQDGRCLLCRYQLVLGCHLHHVISIDDRGPDHTLNLVGLCPNHHILLECVRRHFAPRDKRRDYSWLQRAQAALELVEALPQAERRLFDKLSEPHPLRKEIREGVDPEFQSALSVQIAHADAKVLLEVNKARPRILLTWRVKQREVSAPTTETELAQAINHAGQTACAAEFVEVIKLHLLSLGLPFESSWLDNIE